MRVGKNAKQQADRSRLIAQAGAIAAAPMSCERIGKDHTEFYVPAEVAGHAYVVTSRSGHVWCAGRRCNNFQQVCPHVLGSVGQPALAAVQQIRAANDLEHLEAVIAAHEAVIRTQPRALRALVRREWHHREESLRRSGALSKAA